MKPALRLHWPALLAAVLIVVLGIGAVFLPAGSSLRTMAVVLWGVVPVSLAIAQYAFSRYERFRLLVNRIRFSLANPESTWGLVAEFELADSALAWKAAERAVDESLRSGDRKMLAKDGDAVWNVRGMTLQLTATEATDPLEGDTSILRLEIPPITRPFRAWRRAIDDAAGPLVDHIQNAVQPYEGKFVVRVTFPGDNPYFGLFVSQVQRNAVARFDIEFFERAANEDDVVRVKEDRVEVVTSTLMAALRLSLRYLALTATPET